VKRLLILSVSAGAGHTRAAQALESAAKRRWPAARIENVDILDFAGRIYRKTYVQSYLEMVNRAPELWGYFYRASEHPKRFGRAPKLVQRTSAIVVRIGVVRVDRQRAAVTLDRLVVSPESG